MKKSELNSYIRETIISELEGAINLDKNTNPSVIKKYTAQGIDVNLKEEDDTEDDEEKLDKKAQTAAKRDGSKVSKLGKVTSHLKDLEKEMKILVSKWKTAEGSEKEAFLTKLKEKTKIKKELKALQDKYADSIV
jgi:hypothetical protein